MRTAPAFPTPRFYEEQQVDIDDGMALRDYFAAAYLNGRTAREPIEEPNNTAAYAYKMADAMMKARNA
jgi:hypothetical protein